LVSRRLRDALVIGVLCAWLPFAAQGQNQLPDFGDAASASLSPGQERELGALLMRQIRAQLPVIDDPEIEDYIQSLGFKLVSGGSQGSTDFHFFVLADPTVNAFAIPGGYIGIHSGLVTNTESESELASVVAHEIAHVTQRHIARAIADAEGSHTAASAQSQINFTRTNEKEADRVGIGMLAKAGYDPRAMPTFFEKLDLASRYYSRPPEFLSTHPVTTSRISDSRGRAEQYPYKQYVDSVSYGLTRAKLGVLTTNDPTRLLAEYEANLKYNETGDRSADLYGRALVLARLGKSERAKEELRKLISAHPERVRFRVALATIYEDAYGLFPDSKQLIRGFVDALLRDGQGAKALVILDDYARVSLKDAALYRLEAEAFRQIGKVMSSRMALAEHFYRNGELDAAINQLRLASNEPGEDFYQSSKLDARLKELQSERDYLVRN
jgi:predicted Zn-dependent protease